MRVAVPSGWLAAINVASKAWPHAVVLANNLLRAGGTDAQKCTAVPSGLGLPGRGPEVSLPGAGPALHRHTQDGSSELRAVCL